MIWIPNKSLKFKTLNWIVVRLQGCTRSMKPQTVPLNLNLDGWVSTVGCVFLKCVATWKNPSSPQHVGVFPGHHVKVQEKSVNIGLRKLEEAPYRTSVLDTKAMSFPSQSSWQYHLWLSWLNSPTCAPCQCLREILCRKAAKSVVDMQVPRSEDVWHFARMETLALCSLQWFMYVAVCMFMFCCLLLRGGGVCRLDQVEIVAS